MKTNPSGKNLKTEEICFKYCKLRKERIIFVVFDKSVVTEACFVFNRSIQFFWEKLNVVNQVLKLCNKNSYSELYKTDE